MELYFLTIEFEKDRIMILQTSVQCYQYRCWVLACLPKYYQHGQLDINIALTFKLRFRMLGEFILLLVV